MTAETQQRERCPTCLRGPSNCYCAHLSPFDPKIEFAILIHAREARKHVATGRLAHRSLIGAHLLRGYEYENDERLAALLADPGRHCVALFPGPDSVNLSRLGEAEKSRLTPPGKTLTVVVIDGTWSTAAKLMRRHGGLRALPRVSFDPPAPSRIRLREQPRPECWTTLEAIHQVIDLLGASRGFDVASRAHDGMLRALDAMVNRDIELARQHQPRFWA